MTDHNTESRVMEYMRMGYPPSSIDKLMHLQHGEAHDWVIVHWWRTNPVSRRQRLGRPKVNGVSISSGGLT